MQEELKKAVCEANLEPQKQSLVICSWGNVSGIDPYLRKTSAGGHMIFSSGEIYQSLVKTIEVSGLSEAFPHNRLGNRQATVI